MNSSRSDITSADRWREPNTWWVTIKEQENILNAWNSYRGYNFDFDFLSNLPENIEQALKTKGIYSPPSEPSASLLAEVNPVTSSQYLLERNVLPINLVGGGSGINYISKTGDELSVRSNNVPELTGFFSGTAQVGISKINSDETSTGQIAYSGINSSQITVQKPGTLEKTRLDVGIPQVTVTKFSPNQITTS